NSVDAILNYWDYEAIHGFSCSAPPQTVLGNVLAGSVPIADGFAILRCELLAFDRVWPQQPFERQRDWLQRLEMARLVTLELANRRSVVMTNHESYEPVEGVVRVEPQAASLMSGYPYAHVLGSRTEHSEKQEPVTGAPVSLETRKSPY